MKAVYSSEKDKWSIYIGNENIALISREHPYAKEILSTGTQFNTREFGRRLIASVGKKIAEFDIEILLSKEDKKPKVKTFEASRSSMSDDYNAIYTAYLARKKEYDKLGVEIPSKEEVEKLSEREISEVIKEAAKKLEESDRLLQVLADSNKQLREFDPTDPMQRIQWLMIKNSLLLAADSLESKIPKQAADIRAKVEFYDKLISSLDQNYM